MKSGIVGVVTVMTVLLIAGIAIMIYGIIQKSSNPDFKFFSSEATVEAPAQPPEPSVTAEPAPAQAPMGGSPLPAFGDITLEIPAGFRAVETRVAGTTLIIRLENAAEDRLLMLDLATGSRLGSIRFTPAP